MTDHLKEPSPAPAPTSPAAPAHRAHPVRTMAVDIVAPIALYYGIRAAGGSVWLALVAGGVAPAVSALAGLLARKRIDMTGVVMLAALAASAAFSLITGSPRALLARDGLVTAGWAGYMYLSLLARRPATFTVSRPLLEGRRVFDPATRHWVRPVGHSWDDLWQRLPRFRWIWWICTVIWGTAVLTDAVIRVIVAVTLPISVVPAIGGALWPVTFIMLQVATNVFFARSGFWRILRTGALCGTSRRSRPPPTLGPCLDGVAGWFGGVLAAGWADPLEGAVGELIDLPPGVLLEPVVVPTLGTAIAQAAPSTGLVWDVMFEISLSGGPTADRPGASGVPDLGQVAELDPGVVALGLIPVVALLGGDRVQRD